MIDEDPILEEIHKIRAAIAERFNDDLRAICDDARQRQEAAQRELPGQAQRRRDPGADRSKKAG